MKVRKMKNLNGIKDGIGRLAICKIDDPRRVIILGEKCKNEMVAEVKTLKIVSQQENIRLQETQ